jgi:hypothetical protein
MAVESSRAVRIIEPNVSSRACPYNRVFLKNSVEPFKDEIMVRVELVRNPSFFFLKIKELFISH